MQDGPFFGESVATQGVNRKMSTQGWVVEITEANFVELITDDAAAAIHELRQQLKPTDDQIVTREYLWELVMSQGTRIFTAIIPRGDVGEIVGVVLLCTLGKLGGRQDQLEEFVVHQNYRNLDIGKELLRVAIESSFAQGVRCLDLTTEAIKRPGAAHLYENNGFRLMVDKVVFRRYFR